MSSGKKFNWPEGAWPVQFIFRKESGENEAGLVPQGSMVRPGPRDHKGLKALKEFRNLLVPKENTSVAADKRIVQSGGGIMIKDVKSHDGGMYTCIASHSLGLVKTSATLTVQGNMLLFCYLLKRTFMDLEAINEKPNLFGE